MDLSNITQPRKGSELVIESFNYFNWILKVSLTFMTQLTSFTILC